MAASLELAVKAIRAGRREEGRQLLNLLIQQNPNNEHAWLWMSSVVDTDEQRARCLYHVLAIDPGNQIARKGLQILGIVVTDSRPVKIPRDSQPIKIPKPTAPAQPAFPQAAQLDSRPVPVQERRPFRLDPKAIVEELPFTPVREPFADTSQQVQAEQSQTPSGPVPVIGANEVAAELQGSTEQRRSPSEPVPVVGADEPVTDPQGQTGQLQTPSEPVPVGPLYTGQVTQPPAQPSATPPPPAGGGPFHETRPSQPVPVTPSSMTQQLPQPMPVAGPGGQLQQPVALAAHSNMTVGMPTQYIQPQYPSPPMAAIHSNPTMGIAPPGQPMPASGQAQHPSEPVPAIHSNGTMPMPVYPQPQFQPMMAQGPSIYSSGTMAMPMGYDPLAALNSLPDKNANAAKAGARGTTPEDEQEGDEVNILAVIIFGSLSVTALGGLGMLILLMFTAG